MSEKIKSLLDRIRWKAFASKTLIDIFAVIISEFGIGCFYACNLGTDPISVLVDGLHYRFDMSYGTISTIFNVLWAILILLLLREKFGIGVLLGVLLGGPFIDIFSGWLCGSFPPETTPFLVKALLLIAGEVTFALGTALSIGVNLGIGTWSFPPLWLSKVTKWSISVTQVISDALTFVIGWLLGGVVGIGTIVAVLSTGPIIGWVMDRMAGVFEKIGPIFRE